MKPSVFSGGLTQILIPSATIHTTHQSMTPDHHEANKAPQDANLHDVLKMPPTDITWETVIERQDLEKHLINYNKQAFRAAAASPCGHGQIYEDLGFMGLSEDADLLLKGHLPPTWNIQAPLLQDFLLQFAIPANTLNLQPISTVITDDEVKQGFTKWKERTTTLPSGRHLGHYRSIVQDTTLLMCFTKFMNIIVTTGISLHRWGDAVNVLIEKDAGQPKINRLRIIHLFEADYNLFLKLIWGSRLVHTAVANNLLNDGQHGSVPGRTTMDPIMLQQLTTNLCHILNKTYAHFDNDASACYDRIIVPLAMLAARRCGMTTSAITLHASTLQQMRYRVKTHYGVSDNNYTGTPDEPLFGTGQGSGASPAAWLTLVVVLMNAMEAATNERIRFWSPDNDDCHSRLLDAFVDDTALSFTEDSPNVSYAQVVTRLETVAQAWERLLFYSGGALNLSKCSWQVLHWTWIKGRSTLTKTPPQHHENPGVQLYTQNDTTNCTPIKAADYNQPTRILGVYLTSSGDFTHQLQLLKQKADKMADTLLSPSLRQLTLEFSTAQCTLPP
jgi:hypothetical protein